MDPFRKIPKKFTKKFGNKVINRQYFRRKTGLKFLPCHQSDSLDRESVLAVKKVSNYSLTLKGEKRFSSLDIPLSVQALMEDFMFIDFMRFHMVLCHDPINV